MLRIDNHSRDSAGLRYVYPVISRRAGGVSVGINLNPNNACNWACIYCQVEGLQRGGPPPIDLSRLESELSSFLSAAVDGDFLEKNAPPEARRLVDVAFSGNGEPTSAAEFPAAVDLVGCVLRAKGLELPVRLITNGSLLHRPAVQHALQNLATLGGEVWFKLDRADSAAIQRINGIAGTPEKAQRNLQTCASLVPTWVQTCWFALDGAAPDAAARQAYCQLLQPLAAQLKGVHLYGLARPSMQPEAPRLSALPVGELQAFADEIQKTTGLRVLVSP